MADRRNLLGALAVAVFVTGGAALLSYIVALGAQDKHMRWAALAPVVCYGVIGAGALLGGFVLWLFHRAAAHRRRVDAFALEGSIILMDLASPLPGRAQERNAVTRARTWRTEVVVWLHDNLPHWEGHFRNTGQARHFDDLRARGLAAGRAEGHFDAAVAANEEIVRAALNRLAEIEVALNQ